MYIILLIGTHILAAVIGAAIYAINTLKIKNTVEDIKKTGSKLELLKEDIVKEIKNTETLLESKAKSEENKASQIISKL
jgi:hypothetical protein